MSLTTTIGAGSLIGAVAAFAVYAAASPNEDAVTAPVAARISPVPTPTVTQTADDCEPPAVLTGSECIVTTPGRTIVVPAPAASVDAWDDSDGRVDSGGRDDDVDDAWDDSDGRDDDSEDSDDRDDDDSHDDSHDRDDDRDDD